MSVEQSLPNFIGDGWQGSAANETLPVLNPATGETIGRVPLSPAAEVDRAVTEATAAFAGWRRTPAGDRVQYLFRLKQLLEDGLDETARLLTTECGKTLAEARGELRRGIDNVEAACGVPSLMQGSVSEQIAPGIDESLVRQPLGVVAAVTPFNFPGMIPLWFLPWAIACGNTFILKPSEKVPLTSRKLFELLAATGLPPGVAQLVHGAGETVDALVDHPDVAAISFVGSSPVARAIYARAAARGKRVQCQGGAKNPVIVLPDADLAATIDAVTESAFGCAGQRCLAASMAITVGDARGPFTEAIVEAARGRVVGNGLDDGVEMGPMIRAGARERAAGFVERGASEGGRLLVDGRTTRVAGHEGGFFLGPTVLDDIAAAGEIATSEIFGPVFGLTHVPDIARAIELVNSGAYGNMACLFTSSGAAARRFRTEVDAGNVGINIGVAAPLATFPFCGRKESFFGDLHAQGRDAIEFYTDKKVVIERW